MDNFRRLIAETVDSEQLQSVEVKYQFQHAHPFTGYLRPRRILEKRLTHLVGHFLSRQLGLCLPKRTDLGDGVNPGRDLFHGIAFIRRNNGVTGRSTLIISRAGQPTTSPAA